MPEILLLNAKTPLAKYIFRIFIIFSCLVNVPNFDKTIIKCIFPTNLACVRKDANNKDVKTETNNTFTQESF